MCFNHSLRGKTKQKKKKKTHTQHLREIEELGFFFFFNPA